MDEILRDEETRRRITILEGFPTVRELVATNVNRLNLTDSIFRSEKLVDRTGANQPTPPQHMVAPPVYSTLPPQAPPPSTTTTPGSASGLPSYAGVISSASPPPAMVLPIPPKSTTGKAANGLPRTAKPALWNPGRRGLDVPFQVNQGVLDSIKKRKDRDKLCNNHYLRGPCAKGDSCCFEHKYRPSQEEKTAIAFLARLNPCTNGQDCEVEDCIYGHHVSGPYPLPYFSLTPSSLSLSLSPADGEPTQCPSVRDGQCTHPYCKFRPDEHPPNTKFRPTYNSGEY